MKVLAGDWSISGSTTNGMKKDLMISCIHCGCEVLLDYDSRGVVVDFWSCKNCGVSRYRNLTPEKTMSTITSAYDTIRPPSSLANQMQGNLSLTEEITSALCTLSKTSLKDVQQVVDFLKASDISTFRCTKQKASISKLFDSKVVDAPGLLQVTQGEQTHRLMGHQTVSLFRMTQIENRSNKFGDLRGGIFADEPGLGGKIHFFLSI
jgi:hypothetical protein